MEATLVHVKIYLSLHSYRLFALGVSQILDGLYDIPKFVFDVLAALHKSLFRLLRFLYCCICAINSAL
jgi:hypothetical protein